MNTEVLQQDRGSREGPDGAPAVYCVPAPHPPTFHVDGGSTFKGVACFGLKDSAERSGGCGEVFPAPVPGEAKVGRREDGNWLTKDPLFILSGVDANQGRGVGTL